MTPLDQILGNLWTDPSTQSTAQTAVRQAVLSQRANTYNIKVTIPQQGSLRAQVGNVSPGLAATLPPGTQAVQLTISFTIPGFDVTFKETTNSVWGSWADPAYDLKFDGEVEIAIAVPADPRVTAGATAVFWARNLDGSAANFFAGWIGFWDIVFNFFTQTGPGGSPPDQSQGIGGSLAALYQLLLQIQPPLAQAFTFGFQQLSAQTTTNPLPDTTPGNTVEIDLAHPVDPPPTVSNAAASSVPRLFSAQIGASPAQVHPGDPLGVAGSYFPAAQASELTVTWTDTTSGSVVKSEVTWGVTPNTTTPPANPQVVNIQRHGAYDNANTFTAKPLLPDTLYAFQVRDFDVPGVDLIATQRSAWTYFRTAATDQVQLVLDYNNTLIGFATLQTNGTFVTTVIVPANVPAGTYVPWAVLAGQKMAQTPITVVAQNSPLAPSLQILDPDTSIPITGAAIVEGMATVRLLGNNYSAGTVDLFVDTASGTSLGSAVADSTGRFTKEVTWPFGVVGSHVIVGKQGTAQAQVPVFAENPPQ